MSKVKSGVRAAGVALVMWGSSAVVVGAEEYICRYGEQVRRVELKRAVGAGGVPCQVLYWRNAGAPSEPQIVWRAEFDLQFCVDKTDEMIERMSDAGWRCEAAVETAKVQVPSASRPAEPRPADRTLRLAVGRDLRRLEELVGVFGGRFELIEAALGDLDGDGVADAAVVLRYDAQGRRTGSFLLAYRFQNGTFEIAAKTPLPAAGDAELGLTIQGGVIELRGGGPTSRSDAGPMAFALRAGRLKPIADAPTEAIGVGGPAAPAEPDS